MNDQSSQEPSSADNRGSVLEIVGLTVDGEALAAEWYELSPPEIEHFIEICDPEDLPASTLGGFPGLLVKYPITLLDLFCDDDHSFGHEVDQATDALWGVIEEGNGEFELQLLFFTSEEDRDTALKAMQAIPSMSEGQVEPVEITVTDAGAPLDVLEA